MGHFHKVFIPSSSVPRHPVVLLLLWQPGDWFIMHQSTFFPVDPSVPQRTRRHFYFRQKCFQVPDEEKSFQGLYYFKRLFFFCLRGFHQTHNRSKVITTFCQIDFCNFKSFDQNLVHLFKGKVKFPLCLITFFFHPSHSWIASNQNWLFCGPVIIQIFRNAKKILALFSA